VSDVDELEADLEKEFAEIAEQWRQRAGSIDALEIGLEKTDIVVEPPILLWIPIN
jgi:hypothetical protein